MAYLPLNSDFPQSSMQSSWLCILNPRWIQILVAPCVTNNLDNINTEHLYYTFIVYKIHLPILPYYSLGQLGIIL